MPPRLRSVNQLAIDETVMELPDLEQALENRQTVKDELSSHQAAYKRADDRAKGEVEKLELPTDGAVRVGRFRITRSTVSARSVAFDVEASTRVRITVMEPESGGGES